MEGQDAQSMGIDPVPQRQREDEALHRELNERLKIALAEAEKHEREAQMWRNVAALCQNGVVGLDQPEQAVDPIGTRFG